MHPQFPLIIIITTWFYGNRKETFPTMSSSSTFKAFATSCRVLPITSSQAHGEKVKFIPASVSVWKWVSRFTGASAAGCRSSQWWVWSCTTIKITVEQNWEVRSALGWLEYLCAQSILKIFAWPVQFQLKGKEQHKDVFLFPTAHFGKRFGHPPTPLRTANLIQIISRYF